MEGQLGIVVTSEKGKEEAYSGRQEQVELVLLVEHAPLDVQRSNAWQSSCSCSSCSNSSASFRGRNGGGLHAVAVAAVAGSSSHLKALIQIFR